MANQADVRVRLSAEGQAEVISAFQKVAAEGKKSGEQAGEAFKELNKQLGEVGKTLTGGLGLVLIAEQFVEFFKSTLEGAENLTRLSAQTGLTTDAIQAFGRAARETGVGQDVANAALARFTVATGKAEIGSKQSGAALSDLGIKIKDFATLSPDQKLLLVAQRLAEIPDPARRARDEVALFSKSGVEMDQALVKIGEEGLNPFIQKMKDLGVFLDGESIASIKASAESFKNMGDIVKGLATQFLTGLVPSLAAAVDELALATNSDGVAGLKNVGDAVGTAFRYVVNALEHTGNNVAALIVKTKIFFTTLADQAKNILNPAEVKRLAQESAAAIAEVQAENERRNKEADDRLNRAPEAPKAPTINAAGAGGSAPGNAQAIAKAQLALLEQKLTNELNLYKAHATLLEQSDKAAYDAGALSLADYYAKRAAIINAESDKEIAIARAKRAAVASTPIDINDTAGELNQRRQLLQIDNEIALLEVRRAGELAQNLAAQSAAQKKNLEDQLSAEGKILQIEGRRADAARLKLALDIASLDAELRRGGSSDQDRGQAESKYSQQGNAQINFDQQSEEASAALKKLETDRQAIENQVRTGELFSIQAAAQIVTLDKARLPALQAQAAAMLELAKETGNALDVQKAEEYKSKIDQIAASTNQLGIQTAQLKAGIEGAVGQGINKFLTDAVSGTKTLKQSFTDLALSMLADLEKVAEKIIEEDALKAIFGSGGGAGGGASSGLIGSAASFIGTLFAAEGGHIKGPGTSTSDSIPARLSDGEFVVNAKTTSQPGILPLLTALNAGSLKGVNGPTQVPKFAAGGQVGGTATQTHKIVNVLDPSTLGDHLATSAGEKSVLNIISRNPSRVRNSLGT